jgi:DNA mismatch repair protein MutL
MFPRVLGQYLDTYIVAAGEEGIFIIDQHNAHERVLFEKYKEIDAQKRWPQKIPLIPLLVDLSPSQVLSLEKNQPLLEDAGFRVEAMGGRTFVLNAFPDIFEAETAKEVFLALLEEIGEEEMERRREKLLATLACRTAVKAHEALPEDKMNYLVEELFKTSNPSLCPHGRPVVIKVEKNQIEKGLKRIS